MEINNLLHNPVDLSLGNETLPLIEQKTGTAPEPVCASQRKENYCYSVLPSYDPAITWFPTVRDKAAASSSRVKMSKKGYLTFEDNVTSLSLNVGKQ
jgi:hypothetical protein